MEVKVLRWPADQRLRDIYRDEGVPRLLMLEDAVPPPLCDLFEDWVRIPISISDLRARVGALRERVTAGQLPVLDCDGVLRFGGRRVALTALEARLARPLVELYRSVVDREDLLALAGADWSTARRNALDLRILRLRRKIQPLRLVIRTVWRRGYLLDSVSEVPAVVRSPVQRAIGR